MPDTLSGSRARELALNMLLNALDALERRPGDDSRLIARLWVLRATALLKEAGTVDPAGPEGNHVDRLLVAVSDRLRAYMADRRPPAPAGRFSRLSHRRPGKEWRDS